MLRRNTRLSSAVLAAVVVATTACTSETTGEPTPTSASASAGASPAFPSESVPPGVEKDSVLDLNSTKDMTGVVTTVPFGESPYAAHLPDICTLVPATVMEELGVTTKKRGFRGTQLVVQGCNMQHLDTGDVTYNVTVGFYTNNLSEISAPGKAVIQRNGVKISSKISGRTSKLPPTEPGDPTFREQCGTAWGTFFGAIVVNYRTSKPESVDPCSKSESAARIIAPYMPKSPSEMRPTP